MSKLDEARRTIDEIDTELVSLFEKRMNAVKKVVEYKIEHDLPVLDSSREQEIIEKNCSKLNDELYVSYFLSVYKEVLNTSKLYQQHIIEEEN